VRNAEPAPGTPEPELVEPAPVEPVEPRNPSNLSNQPFPLRWALAAAVALVVLRSAVFVFYEQAHFDSDQAITGLMARDLAHLQGFPLYFYGQRYLLAVEAWLAAPFLLLLGTSVAALKLPVLLLNAVAVTLLVWLLARDGGLRPGAALIASLFFALPPPVSASRLVEAAGCNIEPFVFVPLLWLLRARPFWFGVTLAIATLTREFAMYAATALAVIAIADGRYRIPGVWRYLVRAAAGAAAVMLLVTLLAGMAANLASTKPAPTLAGIGLALLPSHAVTLITQILPTLLGARRDPLAYFNIASAQASGHHWLAPVLLLALAAAAVRVGSLVIRRSTRTASTPFLWFLLLVGVQAAGAFVLISNTDDMQVRYVLLALLIPVALVALHLRIETVRGLRAVTVAVVLLWAGASLADHAALGVEYATRRPPNAVRELALYLENNGIAYGDADYWTAYHVTYLTDTRVILTPRSLVRIASYESLVAEHADTAAHIALEPCLGAAHIRRWYVCR